MKQDDCNDVITSIFLEASKRLTVIELITKSSDTAK